MEDGRMRVKFDEELHAAAEQDAARMATAGPIQSEISEERSDELKSLRI